MKWLFMKQGYISWPILCIATLGFMHYKGLIFNISVESEALMDQAGNLLGFLLAFTGIIVALPPETHFIQFITRYSHHNKVIRRCLLIGIVSFIITIISTLSGIYKINTSTQYMTIYIFLVGLAAMSDIIFYLVQLFHQKFRDIRK